MPHDPYKALYLHIPFCKSRCGYCDFHTRAADQTDARIDDYIEELIVQIRRQAKAGELAEIETVYLGGGTPSHIGMARLSSLLYALSLSMDLTRDDLEFTMEANPESLTDRMVKDIWALGVNRLSIGVQSLNDDILQTLGRAHSADDARRAVHTALERFDNVSIDLMCGIPGQTDEILAQTLEEAIKLGVKHISVYPLSIEEHTPFDKLILSGQMEEPDDDAEARQMLLAEQMLQAAAFERYEVASYALPGYACRHNESYWTGVPYLGIGEAATTMTQNDERRMRVMDGTVVDDLNLPQMLAEDLMLGMRMTSGISDELAGRAQAQLPRTGEVLAQLRDEGYVVHEEGRWRPTRQGWLCGNDLYGRLLQLADE